MSCKKDMAAVMFIPPIQRCFLRIIYRVYKLFAQMSYKIPDSRKC